MSIIRISIDVTKIEKARLVEGKKGGKYLNCVLLGKDQPDQYGNDFMIVQEVTQEERKQGVKGPILGNGKNVVTGGQVRRAVQETTNQAPPPDDTDDVPF